MVGSKAVWCAVLIRAFRFHDSTWFYMDWTTGKCMSNDFGIGMVFPEFLVNNSYPKHTGTSFIYTYADDTKSRRDYVNTTVNLPRCLVALTSCSSFAVDPDGWECRIQSATWKQPV